LTSKVIFLTTTGAGTWTVPSDWSSINTIVCIGAGAGGPGATTFGGSTVGPGAGGGAWAQINNISAATLGGIGANVNIGVGAGGAGGVTSSSLAGSVGGVGGDTWFNSTSLSNAASLGSTVACAAQGGKTSTTVGTGGAGGSAASSTGTSTSSGGAGGASANFNNIGGAGGGAGGPQGAGGAGGAGASGTFGGSGGGGSGGGGSGTVGAVGSVGGSNSGAGGNNAAGVGGGAAAATNIAGNAGTLGGGGSGGGTDTATTAQNGGNGGAGADYTSNPGGATAGSGGGAGGGGAANSGEPTGAGGIGGLYGGGGGPGAATSSGGNLSAGGAGAQGIIIITYTPAGTVYNETSILTGTDDGGGNAGLTFRQVIPSSQLAPGAGGETQFRVTILFGTSAVALTGAIHSMHGGRGAPSGNAYSFASTPTQITFSGANTANCSGAAATLVSDWVNLPESFDATKPFVVAFAPIASGNFHASVATLTGAALWFTTGVDDGTQSPSGYVSDGAVIALVTKIEIQGVAAAPFVPNNFWQQLGPALAQ
jgi:hypothetical protein